MILTHANKSQEKSMATSKKESVFQIPRTLGNIRRWCVLAFGTWYSWWMRGWEVTLHFRGGASALGHLQLPGASAAVCGPLFPVFTGGHFQPPGLPTPSYAPPPLPPPTGLGPRACQRTVCTDALHLLGAASSSPSLRCRDAPPVSWPH